MTTTDDDDLVTIEAGAETLPEVEKPPPAQVPIGDRLWRVNGPKLMAWRATFLAMHAGDGVGSVVGLDDFLRHCMDAEQWQELLEYIEASQELDWPDLLRAGRDVMNHYQGYLAPQAEAIGLMLSAGQDDAADEADGEPSAPARKSASKKG